MAITVNKQGKLTSLDCLEPLLDLALDPQVVPIFGG
jgi:hypothetical protein